MYRQILIAWLSLLFLSEQILLVNANVTSCYASNFYGDYTGSVLNCSSSYGVVPKYCFRLVYESTGQFIAKGCDDNSYSFANGSFCDGVGSNSVSQSKMSYGNTKVYCCDTTNCNAQPPVVRFDYIHLIGLIILAPIVSNIL